nr:hypothetical protein [Porphyrostromium japonicum]
MTETFFLLPITRFRSVKRKTRKILYTELSYSIKVFSSVLLITLYKPASISLIMFYIFFLLLIYYKLYSTNYISYTQVSSAFVVFKVTILIIMCISGKKKGATGDELLSTLDPNNLVKLNIEHIMTRQENIQTLLQNIGEKCLGSIYKIEVTSLISIIASKLLVVSIRPQTMIHSLQYTFFGVLLKSEIYLIYTFSSQIYSLISEQVSKVRAALKVRTSGNPLHSLFTQDRILEFFILCTRRKEYNLKIDIMASAQLSSSESKRCLYTTIEIKQILKYSNKVLVVFISSLVCFLVSA